METTYSFGFWEHFFPITDYFLALLQLFSRQITGWVKGYICDNQLTHYEHHSYKVLLFSASGSDKDSFLYFVHVVLESEVT